MIVLSYRVIYLEQEISTINKAIGAIKATWDTNKVLLEIKYSSI